MIAADTSAWAAFLDGADGKEIVLRDRALEDRQLRTVPVVLTELLSDPSLPPGIAKILCDVPRMEIGSDYW
jgi:hypothetical protein